MEKKSLLMFGLSLFSALIMMYFISMIAVFMNIKPNDGYNLGVIVLLQILVFLSPIAFVSTFFKSKPTDLIKYNFQLNYKMMILAIAGLLFVDLLNNSIISIQEGIAPYYLKELIEISKNESQNYYSQLFVRQHWYQLIIPLFVGAIIPAFCEEIFFRGLLQHSLSRYPKWIMIIIPALLFAMFHSQLAFLIPQIIIGVYLAFITYYSNNIVPAIILHFLNNLKSILMMNVYGIDNQNIDIIYALTIFPLSLYFVYYIIMLIRRNYNFASS